MKVSGLTRKDNKLTAKVTKYDASALLLAGTYESLVRETKSQTVAKLTVVFNATTQIRNDSAMLCMTSSLLNTARICLREGDCQWAITVISYCFNNNFKTVDRNAMLVLYAVNNMWTCKIDTNILEGHTASIS